MNHIAVIGGTSSSLSNSTIIEAARELGYLLGTGDAPILTCGIRHGVIGIFLDALANSSTPRSAIVLRGIEEQNLHTAAGSITLVHSIDERKALFMDHSRGIIALPGGLGTHDEIISFLILARGTPKRIALLNVGGYYDPLMGQLSNMVSTGFLKQEALMPISSRSDVRGVFSACMDTFNGSSGLSLSN